jgi:hypothetical protein
LQSIEGWEAPQFAFLEVLKLAHCKELTVIAGPMKFLGYILGSAFVAEGGTKSKYQQTILDGYERWKKLYGRFLLLLLLLLCLSVLHPFLIR